jgi:hypothetical protein
MPKEKTAGQIRAMFGLAKEPAAKCGQTPKEFLEDLASSLSDGKNAQLSKLTFKAANAIIAKLGGRAFGIGKMSKRTEQFHHQQAGVKRIETSQHLALIERLARGRGMTSEGLENLCRRILGRRLDEDAAPRTTDEGNKIVQALKAMNKRDGGRPKFTTPGDRAA